MTPHPGSGQCSTVQDAAAAICWLSTAISCRNNHAHGDPALAIPLALCSCGGREAVRHEGRAVGAAAVLPVEPGGRRWGGELRHRPLDLRHLAEHLIGVPVLRRRAVVRGAPRAAPELPAVGLPVKGNNTRSECHQANCKTTNPNRTIKMASLIAKAPSMILLLIKHVSLKKRAPSVIKLNSRGWR